MAKTSAEDRAKQLACNHPGDRVIIHWSNPRYYRCELCGFVAGSGNVHMIVRGAASLHESAIDRASVELSHDNEDLQEAMYEWLLKDHGYDPLKGNVPPGLHALQWEFTKKWPGASGEVARNGYYQWKEARTCASP